jgi:hypothetical protein
MARTDDNDASTAIPEADRVEQEQPADPRTGDDQAWTVPSSQEADEGDRLEQAYAVDADPDEEYTPDPG